MSATELVAPVAPGSSIAGPGAIDLMRAVLSGRNERTAKAYRGDYEDFARFLKAESPEAALRELTSQRAGTANYCALAYRASLTERGLSPATITRRLSALRAAVKIARITGLVDWELQVDAPKAEAYRDTRGPGGSDWSAILRRARAEATTPVGRRNLAIVLLLRNRGLRRQEALDLDLADLDLRRGVALVRRKGKAGELPLTIAANTRAALADWLAVRGDAPGPLFTRLDPGAAGLRLTGRGLHKIVHALGGRAGLSRPLAPHQLRHSGITAVLDRTGGDVRAAQRFSGHSKIETLMRYDDNRQDLGGRASELIDDE